ncbi:MAG: hypothetical protein ACE5LF_03120 [Alphaproteobacteria bacterium]
MKKQKAAILDSSLLVRKGEAKPSVFSPGEPAHPGWPAEHEIPANGAAPETAPETTPETTTVTSPETTMVSPAPEPHAAAVARKADTAAVMERIKKAMAGRSTIPFPRRGAAVNDPIDLAAVKRAMVAGSLPGGKAAARRLASRRSRKAKKRVALTLRLDPERHLRLKIFAAYAQRSIQNVLSCALDDYLDLVAATAGQDCACLGARRGPGTLCGGNE